MSKRAPTLLVIEDSEDQAILVSVAARRAHPGLEVQRAADGLVGISYLGRLPPFDDQGTYGTPQLVILDLIMPEVDGFEVLSWVKHRPEPLGIPVVVLTSTMKPRDEARALELGATAVFRKPMDLNDLGDVVRTIVQRWIPKSEMIGAHIWAAG